MRQDSVRSLISHAKKDLVIIEREYNASLKQKEITHSLQIDIKNLMENLRSALDYMAHDIYENIIHPIREAQCQPEFSNIYFPYGKDKNDFKSAIGKNLPKLDSINSSVFSYVESIQPHKCGNNWLYNLCSIVNHNKHNSLTPQTKTESKTYKVGPVGRETVISATAGAIQASPGAIRIGNSPLTFNPETGIPYQTPDLNVEVTIWISFLFSGTGIEVLQLLRKAHKEIDSFENGLYTLIH